MPQGRLLKMKRALDSAPPKTVVSGRVKYFADEEVSDGYKHYESWLNNNLLSENPWKNVYRECIVASPCWMMRTAELRSIGGFSNLQYPEDYDLVFKWYQNSYSILAIDEVLLHWREHPERTSRNSENYTQETFFNLKVEKFVECEIDGNTLILWGTGTKAKLIARLLLAKSISFRWMDLHPQKYPHGILNQPIFDFREIERMQNIKLILAIYPPEEERLKLEYYLKVRELKAGMDYWYF